MITIKPDASLLPLNTMRIYGTANYLIEFENADDLHRLLTDSACEYAVRNGLKPIGQGSNLLFTRPRYDGALLKCTAGNMAIIAEDCDSVTLRVDAGVELDRLIARCCDDGLWGIENLSLIPGTVGAAAVQNVGAYGVEFKDVVRAVNCYNIAERKTCTLDVSEIAYGYRDSIFKHQPAKQQLIVTSVEIRLAKSPTPQLGYGHLSSLVADSNDIKAIRQAVISLRRSKLPDVDETGSAGSFFKNPVVSDSRLEEIRSLAAAHHIDTSAMPVYDVADGKKLSAAWLIDRAGWKNAKEGHAAVWGLQPLVLVNADGKASAADIVRLAELIVNDIEAKFGVTLSPEVEYIP